MSSLPPPPVEPLPYPAPAVPPSGPVHVSSVVCWTLITLACVGLVGLSVLNGLVAGRATTATTRPQTPDVVDAQTRMAGESIVAINRTSPADAKNTLDLAAKFTATTPEARLAMAVVAGEVEGRAAALRQLRAIDNTDARAFEWFYADAASRPAAAPVTPADWATLRHRYGWFADLAESFGKPADNAFRAEVLRRATHTASVMTAGVGVITGAIALGVAACVTAIVLVALGKLPDRLGRPTGPSQVYVEAFTIYLGLLIGVGLFAGRFEGLPLWGKLAVQSVSVVGGVAWPFVRGVGWPTLRRDWGVHTGRGIFTEIACGLGGYLAGLPVVALAFLVGTALLKLTGETTSHPATRLAETNPYLILLLASVYAPLTEELMFRGALVGHLRGTWGVFMAALINGVVFASVHPQGWALVPTLACIGGTFGLIRQWRGSLLPSMAAHCLNNTFVLLLVLLTQ